MPRPQALALGLFGVMLYGAIFFWRYRLALAGHITFAQWLRAGLLITIPTMALASLLLLLQLRP